MKQLREKRKKANLTLKEVAADLGISIASLSHYEKGHREPTLATLKRMSEYFNCTINELL